jgi:hypothetical protein
MLGGSTMTIRKYLYAAAIAAAVSAFFVFGWASPISAKGKAEAGPDPFPCWNDAPVCGSRSGHRFTYANACSARRDGAKVVSHRACSVKKAHRSHRAARRHYKAKKTVTRPAKPAAAAKPAPKSATAPAPAPMQKMDMKPAPATNPPAEKSEAKPAAKTAAPAPASDTKPAAAPAATEAKPAPTPASQPVAPQNTETKTDTKTDTKSDK